MKDKRKKQIREKIIRAGFLLSFCASIVFFGLFILYSLKKDFNEAGHYLEGIGIIVAADRTFLLLVLGMVFFFITILLRFEMSRGNRLP